MKDCLILIIIAIAFCIAGVKGYFLDKKNDCFYYLPFAIATLWLCLA